MNGMEYLSISGYQSYEYIEKKLLNGNADNFYPYEDRYYNININIEGKFETGAKIEGILQQSSKINSSDYINIKIYNYWWEIEAGNIDALINNSIYNPGECVAIKGKIYNNFYGLEGGVSSPQGEKQFEIIYGNNTQGPFYLSNVPIIALSERVFLISNDSRVELFNGKDYTIDYRIGSIKFAEILSDDEYIEIEYYNSVLFSFNTMNYIINGYMRKREFYLGVNVGGEYKEADSINNTAKESKIISGIELGFENNIISILNSANTSIKKDTMNYVYNGMSFESKGRVSYKIVNIEARYYRIFDDFIRLNESENEKLNREISANANLKMPYNIECEGLFSHINNANKINKEKQGGIKGIFENIGSIFYNYTQRENIYDSIVSEYRGHTGGYNRNGIIDIGLTGQMGTKIESEEYKNKKVEINIGYNKNKVWGGSIVIGGEQREYEDSITANYFGGVKNYLILKDYLKFQADGEVKKTNIYLYSGNFGLGLNIAKQTKYKLKYNIETNSGFGNDSMKIIKHNISNIFNFNKIKSLNLQFNNGVILRKYLENAFDLQKTITDNVMINFRTGIGLLNCNLGHGYFNNYSEESGDLISNNKKYYINSTFNLIQIKEYKIILSEEYSVNNGLTMEYIPISYSEEIDTQSYYENKEDVDFGISMMRNYYELGKVKGGVNYIYNYKSIPDSITTNAKSYKGFVGIERNFNELNIDIKITGERRNGSDPEIERTDDVLTVYIISPSVGLTYSHSNLGNAGIIYTTSFYSGDSEQQKHEIGFNTNINFNRFNIYGNGNYINSKYYSTLEYKVGIKIIM